MTSSQHQLLTDDFKQLLAASMDLCSLQLHTSLFSLNQSYHVLQ